MAFKACYNLPPTHLLVPSTTVCSHSSFGAATHVPICPIECPLPYLASEKHPCLKDQLRWLLLCEGCFPRVPGPNQSEFPRDLKQSVAPWCHCLTVPCSALRLTCLSPPQNHQPVKSRELCCSQSPLYLPHSLAYNRQQCLPESGHLLSLLPASLCFCSTTTWPSMSLLCMEWTLS